MKFTTYTFIAFFLLASILVSAVWSSARVYAQSPTTGGLASKPISQELKSIMCDPSNPDLKVVNTTEARICGIPKTVKPDLPSATPQPSPVASLSNPATTNLKSIATKPATTTTTTTTATGITVPTKLQQTVTTKNINAISPSSVYVTWATIFLLSNTSSLPSSTIAPQIAAVSQQQQSQLIPIARVNSTTASNGTAGQNYTFAATSPVPSTSAQLIYLGYHGDTKSSHGNDGSKHDDSSHSKRSSTRSTSDSSSKEKDPKPFTPPPIKIDSIKPPKIHNTKTTSDDSSTSKKKTTSSTKLIKSDNSDSKDNSKSNTKLPHIKTDSGSNLNKKTKHSDHSTDTTTPSQHKITRSNYDNTPKQKTKSDPNDDSSDTKSSSHNSKSSSIIENDIPSVIMKSFNPKHSTDSDSSDEGVDSFFGGDKFFSDEGDDGF